VGSAFRALASAGPELRWEPFFFDWFCGDAGRALSGVRGDLYRGEGFADFRREVEESTPDRSDRLGHPLFSRPEPVELLVDQIEGVWDDIAQQDDWTAFEGLLADIEQARRAWDLQPG
jgi:hypothetical protein